MTARWAIACCDVVVVATVFYLLQVVTIFHLLQFVTIFDLR
jgi:hypothetical protein